MGVRRLGVCLGACAAAALASQGARAETIYELAPTVSAGVTTNANVTTAGGRGQFTTLSNLARLQHRRARGFFSLGYRLSFTHYFQGPGTDTVGNELVAVSTLNLSPSVELSLGATGVLSRTSQVGTLALVVPQSTPGGAALYLATTATEGLAYQPTLSWRFSQSFVFTRIDFPFSEIAFNRRPATSLMGGGRIDHFRVRDGYSLDVRVTDFILEAAPAGGGFAALPGGHNVLGQALVGWRRDLSLAWNSELQGGAAFLSNGPGADVITWSAVGTLGYRERTWFATLQASRVPVANLFAGVATVNEQAQLQLTLPLNRAELVALSGFAGIMYARAFDAQGGSARAYDHQSVGMNLSWRHHELPFAASLYYSFMNQNGGPGVGVPVPDLARHVVMLNLTAVFSFGPGTPPLLEGGRLTLPAAGR